MAGKFRRQRKVAANRPEVESQPSRCKDQSWHDSGSVESLSRSQGLFQQGFESPASPCRGVVRYGADRKYGGPVRRIREDLSADAPSQSENAGRMGGPQRLAQDDAL